MKAKAYKCSKPAETLDKELDEGAIRQMAKLSLSSLYGKTATSKNSSYKKAHQNEVNL